MKKATTKTENKKYKNLSKVELERRIAVYLRQKLSVTEIFEQIKDHPDLEHLSQFLYNSGSYKKLLTISRKSLKNQKKIYWAFILPLIIKAKTKVNTSEAQTLFYTWLKEDSKKYPAIFTCQKWGEYSEDFSKSLNTYLEDLKEKHISEDEELLDRLSFLRVKNLINEESEVIKTLLAKAPKNKKYQQLQKSLKERRAVKTIEDQKTASYNYSGKNKINAHFIPENTEIKQKWSATLLELSNKTPSQTKNLSFFLYFLNWPDESINILQKSLKNHSDYWFYLEWLIEASQYTKSLELINQLLEQVKDSELIFSLIYMKSQTLYYLGKKEEAVEHLNSILQIRPDYRSAQSLLEKWTNQ